MHVKWKIPIQYLILLIICFEMTYTMFIYVQLPKNAHDLLKYLEIVATTASDIVHCSTKVNMVKSFT